MKWETVRKLLKSAVSRFWAAGTIIGEIEHYLIHKRPLSTEGLKWKKRLRFATGIILRVYFTLLVMAPVSLFLMAERTAQAETSVNADVWVYYTMIVPPTVTTDGGATNIGETEARLRGEITSTGNEDPDVWVFWGQADGGTDPGSWTDNASLGTLGLGSFYEDIGSLTASTLYYYQVRAANSAGTDWADSSANFTTTAPLFDPPTGLTLTDLGGIIVEVTWTKNPSANNTLIRISRSAHPETITDQEWLYFGTGESANISGVDADLTTLYVSAWSELSGNYSSSYAYANIGGDFMSELADAVNSLVTAFEGQVAVFNQGFELLLMLVMFAIALWRKDIVIDTASGLILIFTGFTWASNTGGVAVVLIVLGSYQFFKAISATLTSNSPARGLSQFKDIYHRVRGK